MKKWITKQEEKLIIESYELRKGEIIPLEEEHVYEYKPAKNAGGKAVIRIEQDKENPEKRILVKHGDSHGKYIFIDVWERYWDGSLNWVYRNPFNQKLSDKAYIAELECKIMSLERKINHLEEELRQARNTNTTITGKPAGRKPHPEKLEEQSRKVQELIGQGKKEKEIIEELKISRATYYRAKRRSK